MISLLSLDTALAVSIFVALRLLAIRLIGLIIVLVGSIAAPPHPASAY